MIKISKATRREIKEFNEWEWHKVDFEHYGKRVEWREKNFIFKATENGKIVGTMTGKYESGVVYIDTIIVAEQNRGKGIGSLLVKKSRRFWKGIWRPQDLVNHRQRLEREQFLPKVRFQTGSCLT